MGLLPMPPGCLKFILHLSVLIITFSFNSSSIINDDHNLAILFHLKDKLP